MKIYDVLLHNVMMLYDVMWWFMMYYNCRKSNSLCFDESLASSGMLHTHT